MDRSEKDLLLAHILGKSKEFLFLHPEVQLTTSQQKKYAALSKRRANGEPIAYLVGYKYFCGLKFIVNKNVLIPRPETEWLVERAREILKKNSSHNLPVTLDVGTGSGAIAISLAKRAKTKITAVDVSAAALQVAKQNARAHKTKIKFIQSDLFDKVSGKFDLIIANLPYVPLSDYKKLYRNLKYEPKKALTDNTNTWDIYKKFLVQAQSHTKPGATILLEIDPSARKHLSKYIAQTHPKAKLKFFKDLAGRLRYAEITLPKFFQTRPSSPRHARARAAR